VFCVTSQLPQLTCGFQISGKKSASLPRKDITQHHVELRFTHKAIGGSPPAHAPGTAIAPAMIWIMSNSTASQMGYFFADPHALAGFPCDFPRINVFQT
jgi:hypothetical protein